jgi:hypothetical protein
MEISAAAQRSPSWANPRPPRQAEEGRPSFVEITPGSRRPSKKRVLGIDFLKETKRFYPSEWGSCIALPASTSGPGEWAGLRWFIRSERASQSFPGRPGRSISPEPRHQSWRSKHLHHDNPSVSSKRAQQGRPGLFGAKGNGRRDEPQDREILGGRSAFVRPQSIFFPRRCARTGQSYLGGSTLKFSPGRGAGGELPRRKCSFAKMARMRWEEGDRRAKYGWHPRT